MKKGSLWPQVRTKWLGPTNYFRAYQPPVWAKTTITGLFLYVDPIGTVIPEPLRVGGSGYARYKYNQEAGAAYWTWSVIADNFAGKVFVIQDVDPATGESTFHAEWYLPTGVFTPVEQVGDSSVRQGTWSTIVPGSVEFPILLFPIVAIPFVELGEIFPATYAEIFALGADTHDTAPLEWTADFH